MSSYETLPLGFMGFAGQHSLLTSKVLDTRRQPVTGRRALVQRIGKLDAMIGRVRKDETMSKSKREEEEKDINIDREHLRRKLEKHYGG